MSTRLLLCAPLVLLLLTAGCNRRGDVERDALRQDNARLASELDSAYKEIALLKQQRDNAREGLVVAESQLRGLEDQLRRALSTGSIGDAWVSDPSGGVSMSSDFAFDVGSATLNSKGIEAVRALAKELNSGDLRDTKVYIVGHTDNTPVKQAATVKAFGDNWGLSGMRAAAVIRELQKSVDPKRLRGEFHGEHSPRADNGTKDGKAANRRVNVRVSLAD